MYRHTKKNQSTYDTAAGWCGSHVDYSTYGKRKTSTLRLHGVLPHCHTVTLSHCHTCLCSISHCVESEKVILSDLKLVPQVLQSGLYTCKEEEPNTNVFLPNIHKIRVGPRGVHTFIQTDITNGEVDNASQYQGDCCFLASCSVYVCMCVCM